MRSVLLIAAALAFVVASAMWATQPSRAAVGSFGGAKVKLFSNGVVVGEWVAAGPGRVEGNTFVFPIRKGARDLEVRVGGTFSLEQYP